MTKIAVKRPVTTFMVILIFLAFGLMSLLNLQMDLLPNMNIPIAVVMTTYVGASPEQIQTLVTEPVEKALATIDGLDSMMSMSSENTSFVILQFDMKVNIDMAALDMREAVDLMKSTLPDDAGEPMVIKMDINSMQAIYIAVSSSADDLVGLKNKVDDEIVDRLTKQLGVASVNVSGGREKEIRVDLVEDRLRGYGIAESQITALLKAENATMPVGSVDEAAKKLTVKVDGQFRDIEEIKNLPVTTAYGDIIYLRDIAEVYETYKDVTSYAYLNSDQAVMLTIQKQSDANTVNVSRGVMRELSQIIREYPELHFSVILDPADYISTSISSVASSAVSGCILAVIVLFVFLRNMRVTLVVGASIPLSILVTFAFMYFAGMTLNLMSLGGLTLGVGMLVDNSIVVLESIFRRMEEGESRWRAAINGAQEVAMSIVASTLTTVAVFIPVAWVGGLIAQVFNDLALSISFSLGASLLVALTFVPLMCSLFLAPAMPAKHENPLDGFIGFLARRIAALLAGFGWRVPKSVSSHFLVAVVQGAFSVIGNVLRLLFKAVGVILFVPVCALLYVLCRVLRPLAGVGKNALVAVFNLLGGGIKTMERKYRGAIVWATTHKKVVFVVVAVYFIFSVWSIFQVGMELLPAADQSQIDITIELPVGAVLERTVHMTNQVMERLEGIPEIKDVATIVGGGMMMGGGSSDSASMTVALVPIKERQKTSGQLADEIRASLSDIAGAKITVEALTSMMSTGTGGASQDVQYNVKGSNVDTLIEVSEDLIRLIGEVPGTRDVSSTLASTSLQATIEVDRLKASSFGLNAQTVMGMVNMAMSGSSATTLKTAGSETDIRVGPQKGKIQGLEDLENLLIPTPRGISVPLREVANIALKESPRTISRVDQEIYMTVYASLDGRDLGSVTRDIDAKIAAEYIFPQGVSLEATGSQEMMNDEISNLLLAMVIAIFIVYAIMAAEFESMYYPVIIMFSVPIALTTGMVGLFAMNQTLGITSALGMIVLVGVVINNGIVLVDYINLLRGRGLDLYEAVQTACPVRLRPILMATMTTVLGLVPMMLGAQEGSEMMQPLATVVVWGLTLSTLITLFVTPVIYIMFERVRIKWLGERRKFRKVEEVLE